MAQSKEIQKDSKIDSLGVSTEKDGNDGAMLKIAETVEGSVPLGSTFRSFFEDDCEMITPEANDAPLWQQTPEWNSESSGQLYSKEEVFECTNISDDILLQYMKAERNGPVVKRNENQSQNGDNTSANWVTNGFRVTNGFILSVFYQYEYWRSQA